MDYITLYWVVQIFYFNLNRDFFLEHVQLCFSGARDWTWDVGASGTKLFFAQLICYLLGPFKWNLEIFESTLQKRSEKFNFLTKATIWFYRTDHWSVISDYIIWFFLMHKIPHKLNLVFFNSILINLLFSQWFSRGCFLLHAVFYTWVTYFCHQWADSFIVLKSVHKAGVLFTQCLLFYLHYLSICSKYYVLQNKVIFFY